MSQLARGLAPVLSLALLACNGPAAPSSVGQADNAKPDAKPDTKPVVNVDVDTAKAALAKLPAHASMVDANGDLLSFGDAKIMRAGHEDRAFELAADGTVTLAGTPYAKLLPDGRMLSPTGDELVHVQPDGGVATSEGPTGMHIASEGGTIDVPTLKVTLRFADDGAITTEASGPNAGLLGADAPQLRSTGCTGPVIKACALITLSYLSALGNPDSVRQEDAPSQ